MRGLILIIFSTSIALASKNVTVPATVKADEPFNVQIQPDSTYKWITFFLAVRNQNNVCLLDKTTLNSKSNFTFEFPASIGQGGAFYEIVAQQFNDDIITQRSDYSNAFNVTDATAEFTPYELDTELGFAGIQFLSLPCRLYDCVRKCYQANYPANRCDLQPTLDCVSASCPGVAVMNATTWPRYNFNCDHTVATEDYSYFIGGVPATSTDSMMTQTDLSSSSFTTSSALLSSGTIQLSSVSSTSGAAAQTSSLGTPPSPTSSASSNSSATFRLVSTKRLCWLVVWTVAVVFRNLV